MREVNYIFHDETDWLNLVNACVPLDDHENNPSYQILGAVVSNLNNPGSVTDGSLTYSLSEYIPEGEHKNKILNTAVTLYVNMFNELVATKQNHAETYYLIQARRHMEIGMMFLS